MTTQKSSDMGAAFTGLFVGAIVVLVLVFSIVKMTNGMYAGETTTEAPAAP